MNNKDKIILYLDNQLDPEEKKQFEQELKNSPGLMGELENYKKVFYRVKELNTRSEAEAYFTSNIPVLREKLEKKKKFKLRKMLIYASSAAVIILLALSLFIFRNTGNVVPDGRNLALTGEEVNNLTDNFSSQELAEALDVTDSTWNDLLSGELNFSYETADSILKSYNGNVNYTEGLNEEEASLIYDRLINKEFY